MSSGRRRVELMRPYRRQCQPADEEIVGSNDKSSFVVKTTFVPVEGSPHEVMVYHIIGIKASSKLIRVVGTFLRPDEVEEWYAMAGLPSNWIN